MLTHHNLLYNEEMIRQGFGHGEDTVHVVWLPLLHDMGLIGNLLQSLYLGTPCILFSPVSFLQKPLRWLQAISGYKATTSGGPNFAYDLCVEKITPEQRLDLDLSSWTLAFNGAEPIRAETLERFTETFASCGFRHETFYPCYGLAETTVFVSGGPKAILPVIHETSLESDRITDGKRKVVGCGQTDWLEQRVVITEPESFIPCPDEQVGEVWISGPHVAQGYWNRLEETEETFRAHLADTGEGPGDGPFLRTGDLGFLKDGELFVTGRLKDLIIIHGQNYYPQDIELTVERTLDFIKVNGCAAASITMDGKERLVMPLEASRELTRKIKAVLKQQAPSPNEHSAQSARAREELDRTVGSIAAQVREAVAREHEISLYALAFLKPGQFPRTTSGKVQRRACRALFLEERDKSLFFWHEHDETGETEGAPDDDNLSVLNYLRDHNPSLDRTRRMIHDCVVNYLKQAEHLGVNRIDHDRSFMSLGIDFLGVATIREELERELSRKVTLDAIHEFDTVNKLAAQLESESGKTKAEDRPIRPTKNAISGWLVDKIAQLIAIPPNRIDTGRPFASYGLNSIAVVSLSGELGEWLGKPLPPTLVYDYPTIEKLARHIAETQVTEIRADSAIEQLSDADFEKYVQGIPENFHKTDCFVECRELKERNKIFHQQQVDNPYFRVNQAITGTVAKIEDREFISFSSYNYIGLSGDARVTEAACEAIRRYGTSSSASRVVTGEKPVHGALERALAEFLGTESCLVFVSGHATNVTTIGHLFSSRDLIIYDALAHNSIVQGALLSGASQISFAHNDYEQLDAILSRNRHLHERVLIAVEGVYSMDGDIAPLPRLIRVKQKYKAILMVDEAHSIGVLGKSGAGAREYHRIDPADVDIWMGTLSKALVGCGGYIAGNHLLVEYLKNTAPGFVYSVGMTPANAAAALAALEILQREPERLDRLQENSRLFLEYAKAKGLDTGSSHHTPIVPIITGDSARAIKLSHRLFKNGIDVHPIMSPHVPEGEARLRFFITSEHTKGQIDYAVDQTAQLL
uniref:8-amino-7-oxononanoate synthase n=1 Tax=Candidatus Kentrum sp. TUN TaxID=2126343 RepID=A0A451AHV7_9GAMM|nr:MAG: 8-amino-7-oxononanoate synthase [Candidatus Kentron sp. TUN]VFK65620.1 MAG: 8-amino-7-oxononanoate synthase [Candidatus Kentron sp. TUN]